MYRHTRIAQQPTAAIESEAGILDVKFADRHGGRDAVLIKKEGCRCRAASHVSSASWLGHSLAFAEEANKQNVTGDLQHIASVSAACRASLMWPSSLCSNQVKAKSKKLQTSCSLTSLATSLVECSCVGKKKEVLSVVIILSSPAQNILKLSCRRPAPLLQHDRRWSSHLASTRSIQAPIQNAGRIGDHAHAVPSQPREARHDVACMMRGDFMPPSIVRHGPDDLTHLVSVCQVVGDQAVEIRAEAVHRI